MGPGKRAVRQGAAADASAWDRAVDGVCALPLRVVRPITWDPSEDGQRVTIHMDRAGRDTQYRATVIPILEGLEAGDDLPAIVERLEAAGHFPSRTRAAQVARRLVAGLVAQGNVEIVLPDVPAVWQGRYERVRQLGRGGVGIVWLCRDLERAGEEVVVKHAWNWSGSLASRDRMLRDEGEVLRRVDGEGIVRFRDDFEVDGRYHLVRDAVEGEELPQVLLRDGVPVLDQRLELARGVAAALSSLRAQDVLCLDTKPSNFMLEADTGRIVLVDLGHCRVALEERLEVGRSWGTPGYMAPEVRAAGEATPASDVYSFGCLYTYLLTLRAPGEREGVDAVIERLAQAGASDGECVLVRACLDPEPHARPRDLLASLDALA